jgi:hypothetical protein
MYFEIPYHKSWMISNFKLTSRIISYRSGTRIVTVVLLRRCHNQFNEFTLIPANGLLHLISQEYYEWSLAAMVALAVVSPRKAASKAFVLSTSDQASLI